MRALQRRNHSVGRVECCSRTRQGSCKPLSWQRPSRERRMAHGPSRIESALRGRFALVRTGEGIPVSRRVGLVSPWVFLPLLPGRSVNTLDDEFTFFLPLPVLCRTLMMIACLVWFLSPSAMKCYKTTMQLSRFKAFPHGLMVFISRVVILFSCLAFRA